MKKNNMKKGLLGVVMTVAMMGSGSLAQAESYTYYCALSATSHETTNVATYFSMTVENQTDACDVGCANEWADYLRGNYEDFYKLSRNVIAFERLSQAKESFYDSKAFSRKMNQPFHHASDFRCSGD